VTHSPHPGPDPVPMEDVDEVTDLNYYVAYYLLNGSRIESGRESGREDGRGVEVGQHLDVNFAAVAVDIVAVDVDNGNLGLNEVEMEVAAVGVSECWASMCVYSVKNWVLRDNG